MPRKFYRCTSNSHETGQDQSMKSVIFLTILHFLFACSNHVEQNFIATQPDSKINIIKKIMAEVDKNKNLLLPGSSSDSNDLFRIISVSKDGGDTSPGWNAVLLNVDTEEQLWLIKTHENGLPITIMRELRMVPPKLAKSLALASFRAIPSARWGDSKLGDPMPDENDFLNAKIIYYLDGRSFIIKSKNGVEWCAGTKLDGSIDVDKIIIPCAD